jgi:hypothetical protein
MNLPGYWAQSPKSTVGQGEFSAEADEAWQLTQPGWWDAVNYFRESDMKYV